MTLKEEEIQRVFEAWRDRQTKPERIKLVPDRASLIAKRLGSYTADDLVMLIRYAFEADVPEARFWRGDSPDGRVYLGLDNLLRIGKLADRIDRAREWEDENPPPVAGDGSEVEAVGGSTLAALRGRR